MLCSLFHGKCRPMWWMSKTVALPPPNVKTPKMHFLLKTRYYHAITKQELLEFVLLFYEAKYLQSLLILFSLNSDNRKKSNTHSLNSHFPFRADRARLFITTSSFRDLNIYFKRDNIWTHQLIGGRVNVPFNLKTKTKKQAGPVCPSKINVLNHN